MFILLCLLTMSMQFVNGPDIGCCASSDIAMDNTDNSWTDEFDNLSLVWTTGKGDKALNGPAFELSNGTLIPGLVEGLSEVDSGTIALWHFNEGKGSQVNDSSKNSKHGTMNNMNSADWVTGIDGYALDFDGVNDYVSVPWSSVLNPSSITVEAWIYPHVLPPSNDNKGFIVHKRVGYYMMIGQFTIDTPSVVHANAKHLVQKNQWSYLVGTYDGSNVKLYLNGENVATSATTAGITHYNNPLYMGCYYSASTYMYPFDGLIDEVKLSNNARPASEIKTNYDSYLAWKNGYRNTDVHIISEKITIPQNHYWDELSIGKLCPTGSFINVSILDQNGKCIPEYSNITSTDLNISGLDPMKYPSIMLMANFTTKDGNTPVLDNWSVSWRENIPPKILDVYIPMITVRTMTSYITISAFDPDEPLSGLKVDVFTSSRTHEDWNDDLIGKRYYDERNKSFNISFEPNLRSDLGPYSIMVQVKDHLGMSVDLHSINSTFVYSEKDLNIELVERGINVTRRSPFNLTLKPFLDGPLEEVELNVSVTYHGNDIDWNSEPLLIDDLWSIQLSPHMDVPLGWYDISITASSLNFYPRSISVDKAFCVYNEPPEFGDLPKIEIHEDSLIGPVLDISELIFDHETFHDDLILGIDHLSDPDNISFILVDYELILMSLKENWNGESSVVLTLTDDHDDIEMVVPVSVLPVQDTPVLEPVIDMVVMEDTVLTYDFNGSDPDLEDTIKFKLDIGTIKDLTNSSGLSFNTMTGALSLLVTNEMVGVHECNISLSDGKENVWSKFTVEVININDPPVWITVGGRNVENDVITFGMDQDSTLDLELICEDVDNGFEELSFIFSDGPEFGMLDDNILKLSPGWDHIGESSFVIEVSDGGFRVPLTIVIKVKDVPDAPIAVLVPVQGPVYDDIILTLDGSMSHDPDLDEVLKYSWKSNISGSLGSQDVIEVKLVPGIHNITLKVTDKYKLSSFAYMELVVLSADGPIDDGPIDDDENTDGPSDNANTTDPDGEMIDLAIPILAGALLLILIMIAALSFMVLSKKKRNDKEDVEVKDTPELDVKNIPEQPRGGAGFKGFENSSENTDVIRTGQVGADPIRDGTVPGSSADMKESAISKENK